MKIKYFFIVCAVLIKLVKTESECSVHFKCFSEFLRDVIESRTKYAIIIKETKNNEGYDSDTSLLTIEIPSRKVVNTMKKMIDLFDLYFENISENFESTESLESLISDIESLSMNPQTSVENSNDLKTKDDSNASDIYIVDGIKVKSNEVKIEEFDYDFDLEHDNATDYLVIDYIELYKDTTNEPVEVFKNVTANTEKILSTEVYVNYSSTEKIIIKENAALGVQKQCYFNGTSNNITQSVFPWIATIFVRNKSSGRFDYFCDGALLSERSILTAAQCVTRNATTMFPDDLIIILGKRSFLNMRQEEKAVRINEIRVHDNFTNGPVDGFDLAVLQTNETISFNDEIQPACLSTGNDTDEFIQDGVEIATTGWAILGELTAILLDKEKSKLCQKGAISDDTFCANYDNDVKTCPSYGGVFVTKSPNDFWRLRGLRTGEPSQEGFCVNTGAFYTDLLRHTSWIQSNISIKDGKY